MPQVARITDRVGFGVRAIRSLQNSKYSSAYPGKRNTSPGKPRHPSSASTCSRTPLPTWTRTKYSTTPAAARRSTHPSPSESSPKKEIGLLRAVRNSKKSSVRAPKNNQIRAKSNSGSTASRNSSKKHNNCYKAHPKDKAYRPKFNSIENSFPFREVRD